MRIDKTVVVEEAERILEENKETQLQFLERVVPGLIKEVLLQDPDYWKNYGMYWWNLQDIRKNYAPKEYRAYVRATGGEDEFGADEEIKKEYNYGTDMYNWVAAHLYVDYRVKSYQFGAGNAHQHTTEEGDIRQYVPGVGFVDEPDVSRSSDLH
jgi:hypothetical protein